MLLRPLRRVAPVLAIGAAGCYRVTVPAWHAQPLPEGYETTIAPRNAPRAVARAEEGLWRREPVGAGTIRVVNPFLGERIAALRAGSPAFDSAWVALEGSRIPTLIGSGDEVGHIPPFEIREDDEWSGYFLPYPLTLRPVPVARFLVIVRLEHAARGAAFFFGVHTLPVAGPYLPWVDDIIAHEIYGHMFPVIALGHMGIACPDRKPGEWFPSCVEQRTAHVAAEMRHGRSAGDGVARPDAP